jgi:hypothetical protein
VCAEMPPVRLTEPRFARLSGPLAAQLAELDPIPQENIGNRIVERYRSLEMTFLAHLRAPRLDRDAAFEAALRDGRPPQVDRCPYCGQTMPHAPSSVTSTPTTPERSVNEELDVLSNGRTTT